MSRSDILNRLIDDLEFLKRDKNPCFGKKGKLVFICPLHQKSYIKRTSLVFFQICKDGNSKSILIQNNRMVIGNEHIV